MADPIRVQKAISGAGLMSRRAAEEAISKGRVAIDGEVAVLGDRVDVEAQLVTRRRRSPRIRFEQQAVEPGIARRQWRPKCVHAWHYLPGRRFSSIDGSTTGSGQHGTGRASRDP